MKYAGILVLIGKVVSIRRETTTNSYYYMTINSLHLKSAEVNNEDEAI